MGEAKKTYGPEEGVIHLADMAAVPYQAVVRRLNELSENINGVTRSEEDWVKMRSMFNLPKSLLNSSQLFSLFSNYEEVVQKAVEDQLLNSLAAANKIEGFNPKLAEKLQEQEIERYKKRQNNEA